MDLELHGKTALITGSERGIGRAIALAFASAGADVVVASLPINETAIKNMEGVADQIKNLGRKTLVVPVDVSEEQSVINLAAETEKVFPKIDILVNNAGTIILPDHILETSVADFDKMIAVNLRSLFLVCKNFIPAMVKRRWGRVINIASSAGLWGLPDRLSYCSSKFGAVGFTSALAIDMKRRAAFSISSLRSISPMMTAKSSAHIRATVSLARVTPFRRCASSNNMRSATV